MHPSKQILLDDSLGGEQILDILYHLRNQLQYMSFYSLILKLPYRETSVNCLYPKHLLGLMCCHV